MAKENIEEYFSQERFKFSTRYEKFSFPKKISLSDLKNFGEDRRDFKIDVRNIDEEGNILDSKSTKKSNLWELCVGNKFARYKLDRRYKGGENYIIRKNCPFII